MKSSLLAMTAVLAVQFPLSSGYAVTVVNGTFDENAAAYTAWPGYNGGTNPATPTGWTSAGGVGINPVNPPGDGQAPFNDGANDGAFAFLQGIASIEQSIAGFTIGSQYALNIDFNARNCCTANVYPIAEVYLNDVLLASSAALFPPPGGVVPGTLGNNGNWYSATIPFTPTTDTVLLSIRAQPSSAGADTTLIIDNVSIIPEPATLGLLACGLAAGLFRRRR